MIECSFCRSPAIKSGILYNYCSLDEHRMVYYCKDSIKIKTEIVKLRRDNRILRDMIHDLNNSYKSLDKAFNTQGKHYDRLLKKNKQLVARGSLIRRIIKYVRS